MSNMYPTTACIALLALFQVSIAMLVRPAINRWLERRAAWRGVVAAFARVERRSVRAGA